MNIARLFNVLYSFVSRSVFTHVQLRRFNDAMVSSLVCCGTLCSRILFVSVGSMVPCRAVEECWIVYYFHTLVLLVAARLSLTIEHFVAFENGLRRCCCSCHQKTDVRFGPCHFCDAWVYVCSTLLHASLRLACTNIRTTCWTMIWKSSNNNNNNKRLFYAFVYMHSIHRLSVSSILRRLQFLIRSFLLLLRHHVFDGVVLLLFPQLFSHFGSFVRRLSCYYTQQLSATAAAATAQEEVRDPIASYTKSKSNSFVWIVRSTLNAVFPYSYRFGFFLLFFSSQK